MSQAITLSLEQIADDRALLQLASAQGQASHQFELPWLDRREWNAVFWYLTAFSQYPETWPTSSETIETAVAMNLAAADGTPRPERLERIGRRLYQALLGRERCEHLFQRALHSFSGATPPVELHFPEAGRYLPTYPWELLHDGEDFLFDSLRATLARYVKFGRPVRPIKLTGSLNALLVDPRPSMPPGYDDLPRSDRAALRAFSAETGGRFRLEALNGAGPASTFARLVTALNKSYPAAIHAIHIDAHGEFNPKEIAVVGDRRPPQGYLAFSDSAGRLEWISGRKLGKALGNRGVQLVVLSACSSGVTGGGSAFNSVAGALIRQGIPAVVAMQFPIEESSAGAFIRDFYRTLANGAPLVRAVAAARTGLLAVADAWYRPALYLRTDPANMAGKIFEAQEAASPVASLPRPPASGRRAVSPASSGLDLSEERQSPVEKEDKMTDFFISYTGSDKAWAEWIAWQLEEAGFTTVIQAWDFRPGGNFVLDMQRATEQAERTIAVLSQNYLDALYTHPEWAAAFAQDPTGTRKTFLPVRVQACDLKGMLSQIVYIDLVGLSETEAREALMAGLQTGRAKPTIAPTFPGAVKHTVSKPENFPGKTDPPRASAASPPAYDLAKIRRLLDDIFSEDELRDYCLYQAPFRPVHEQLKEMDRKGDILRRMLDHARRRGLLADLLAWARDENETRYAAGGPYER